MLDVQLPENAIRLGEGLGVSLGSRLVRERGIGGHRTSARRSKGGSPAEDRELTMNESSPATDPATMDSVT